MLVDVEIPNSADTMSGNATPTTTPKIPPLVLSTVVSSKNCKMMCRFFAPIARRIPISRVRSVTVANMMFMMPIPPTNKEMPAIEPQHQIPKPLLALCLI